MLDENHDGAKILSIFYGKWICGAVSVVFYFTCIQTNITILLGKFVDKTSNNSISIERKYELNPKKLWSLVIKLPLNNKEYREKKPTTNESFS